MLPLSVGADLHYSFQSASKRFETVVTTVGAQATSALKRFESSSVDPPLVWVLGGFFAREDEERDKNTFSGYIDCVCSMVAV